MTKVLISKFMISLIGAAVINKVMLYTIDREVDKKLKEMGVVG